MDLDGCRRKIDVEDVTASHLSTSPPQGTFGTDPLLETFVGVGERGEEEGADEGWSDNLK